MADEIGSREQRDAPGRGRRGPRAPAPDAAGPPGAGAGAPSAGARAPGGRRASARRRSATRRASTPSRCRRSARTSTASWASRWSRATNRASVSVESEHMLLGFLFDQLERRERRARRARPHLRVVRRGAEGGARPYAQRDRQSAFRRPIGSAPHRASAAAGRDSAPPRARRGTAPASASAPVAAAGSG